MSLLLDTGVLYSFLNEDDQNHGVATQVIKEVGRGTLGRPAVTDFVVDELLTLIRMRKLGSIIESRAIELLPVQSKSLLRLELLEVGASRLDQVSQTYQQYSDQGISFTDASHLVMMREHEIKRLATFDGGFEGLAELVPADFARKRRPR